MFCGICRSKSGEAGKGTVHLQSPGKKSTAKSVPLSKSTLTPTETKTHSTSAPLLTKPAPSSAPTALLLAKPTAPAETETPSAQVPTADSSTPPVAPIVVTVNPEPRIHAEDASKTEETKQTDDPETPVDSTKSEVAVGENTENTPAETTETSEKEIVNEKPKKEAEEANTIKGAKEQEVSVIDMPFTPVTTSGLKQFTDQLTKENLTHAGQVLFKETSRLANTAYQYAQQNPRQVAAGALSVTALVTTYYVSHITATSTPVLPATKPYYLVLSESVTGVLQGAAIATVFYCFIKSVEYCIDGKKKS